MEANSGGSIASNGSMPPIKMLHIRKRSSLSRSTEPTTRPTNCEHARRELLSGTIGGSYQHRYFSANSQPLLPQRIKRESVRGGRHYRASRDRRIATLRARRPLTTTHAAVPLVTRGRSASLVADYTTLSCRRTFTVVRRYWHLCVRFFRRIVFLAPEPPFCTLAVTSYRTGSVPRYCVNGESFGRVASV